MENDYRKKVYGNFLILTSGSMGDFLVLVYAISFFLTK
jgi:hypothetical protein